MYRFVLSHQTARDRAIQTILVAPDGYLVTIKEPTRSSEQNNLMWDLLGDVSEQVVWHGNKLTPEEWKHVFTASLSQQRVVPGIDGGYVVLGKSTSKMGKKQFSDLIELIHAFGAEHDVRFTDRAT